jgi:hypothetical protein
VDFQKSAYRRFEPGVFSKREKYYLDLQTANAAGHELSHFPPIIFLNIIGNKFTYYKESCSRKRFSLGANRSESHRAESAKQQSPGCRLRSSRNPGLGMSSQASPERTTQQPVLSFQDSLHFSSITQDLRPGLCCCALSALRITLFRLCADSHFRLRPFSLPHFHKIA